MGNEAQLMYFAENLYLNSLSFIYKTILIMKKFFLITIFFIIAEFHHVMVMAQIPQTWNSRGIGGGGALFSPSVNPANHNEMYMGCDMSELFHSLDQGVTWSEVSFLKIEGGHESCVQFTNDPDTRYVVDYTSVSGNDYIRPMKSTDGGNTWSILSGNPYPLSPNGGILRLIADFANPNHLIIADYGTIYFSSDGGNSFHQVHTNISSGSGNHIGGTFFDGQNIYIGTNDGLLYSTNGGQTFSTMNAGGIPTNEHILSFAGAKQSSTTRFICLTATNVWAGYTYGDNYWNAMKGIYTMDNASGTWTSNISGITLGSDFPVFVGMSSDNINITYASGGSSAGNPIVMRSDNGGAWSHVFLTGNNQNIYTGWAGSGGDHGWSFPEAPFGFTVASDDANTVMFTDYSCAHITIDGGITWHQQYLSPEDENPMNAPTPKGKKYHGIGMENTSCWQIIWTDSLHLFAGLSDINGIMSDDKGQSWKFIPGLTQNSVYRLVNHPNGTLYASTSNVHDIYQSTRIYDAQIDAGTGAIYYSTDNGNSFNILHNFGHPVTWIAPDPSNPNRMYASVLHHYKTAIGGIYVTENLDAGSSSTWTKLSNPPRCNGHPYDITVLNNSDLVVSYSARKPNNSSAFTDSSGVFYYDHAASVWYDRSDPNMRFWTQDVVVDPTDATQSTWYTCVFEGWGTSGIFGTGGLYRTTDKGLTWFRVNDDFRVNSCTVNPSNHDELYFTTEIDGLWYSANASATAPTFTQVTNYPFRHPMRVFYNPYKPAEIWVSSFGNGMKVSGNNGPNGINDPSAKNQQNIIIFPNPATDMISVTINKFDPSAYYSWDLYDLTGKNLASGIWHLNTSIDLTGPHIMPGCYLLKISSGSDILINQKIIKL